jgi:hypothetical protein
MTIAIIDGREAKPVVIGAGADVASALVLQAQAAADAAEGFAADAEAFAADAFLAVGIERIGADTVSATGLYSGGNFSLMNQEATAIAGFVRTVEVDFESAGPKTFFVASDDSGDNATRLASVTRVCPSGVGTYRVDLPIAIGQIVGVYSPDGGVRYSDPGKAAFARSGLLSTSSQSVSALATYGLQLAANIVSTDAQSAADQSDLGGEIRIGRPTVAATSGVAGTGFFVAVYEPATFDGFITEIDVAVENAASDARIAVVEMNSDGTIDLIESRPFELRAGVNQLRPQGFSIDRGQFVGIISSGGTYQATAAGRGVFFCSGLPGTGTSVSTLNDYGLQMGVTISRGNRATVAQANSDVATGLVGDGSTDQTAVIKAMQVQGARIPTGDYAVTALHNEGTGLWGAGRINLNGAPFVIPRAPIVGSFQRCVRNALMRQIADRSGLIVFGDSISQATINVSPWTESWPVGLTRFINAFAAPGDLPVVTQFSSGASGGVAFGITLPGSPTIAALGPCNQAITLSAGQSLTFTGAYAFVDVTYQRASGAGSIAFAFNGGSAYKTVSADGAAANDLYTGPSATGQSGSGTYTITAIGGSVTITSVIRLQAEIASTVRRLPVINVAVNSMSAPLLTTARLQSAIRIAKVFGGASPAALVAFGTNESISTLPSQIYTDHVAMIAAMRSEGIKTIWGCDMVRPADGTYSYSAGCSYEGACGAVRAAYQDSGVPIIPLSAIDFAGSDYFDDGIHPITAGQRTYLQAIAEGIAAKDGG